MALFTYSLIDGRRVTYAGATERHAFNVAREYHGAAVEQSIGTNAARCAQDHDSGACAESTRRDGYLICTDCAGYLG